MDKVKNYILRSNLVSKWALRAYDAYKSVKTAWIDFEYEQAQHPSLTKSELIQYNKNRKFTVDKNICFAPKSSMLFSFDGNVYLCCENKSHPIGNILTQTVSEIWHGEKRRYLDTEINQHYNLKNGCLSCERKIKQQEYSLALAQTFDLYKSTNTKNYPTRLDFEIHNTCNLECVMCGGIYSSSIQANRNKMPAIKMLYDADFVRQLDEFLPYVNYINLIGGEPTLIKIYYDIMESAIAHNPKCVIHLQTNASSLNARFRAFLEKGNFQIGISIDSLRKEKVEQIRKNLVFETFMQNIQYYIGLYAENKIKLTVNTCPMPENWEDVLDVVDFCNQHKLPIFFCIVNAPYFSSFESVTVNFIRKVVAEYRNKLMQLPKRNYFEINNYNRLKDLIQQIENYIPIIESNNKNRLEYADKDVETLIDLYRQKLLVNMVFEEKDKLVERILQFLLEKLKTLETDEQKTILQIALISIKDKFYVTTAEENLRWAMEFI
ncbi:MAG: radical SAM protein [Bacteroidetes bacterium]|nr:radical SAM protein [Bacteroidota bacterium]